VRVNCTDCKRKQIWWFARDWTGHQLCRECYDTRGYCCNAVVDPDKLAAAVAKIGSSEEQTQSAALRLLTNCEYKTISTHVRKTG
jgi:hypothetical protein